MSEERACSGFGRHSTGSGWEESEDIGRLTSLPIPRVARGPIPKGVKKPRIRKPKKVVKKGRPAKWVPAILSEEHVDHANRVLHEYGIDDSQRPYAWHGPGGHPRGHPLLNGSFIPPKRVRLPGVVSVNRTDIYSCCTSWYE